MGTENVISIIVGGGFEQPFTFAIPVSPELFAQFVARMLDCTVLDSRSGFLCRFRARVLRKIIHSM